MLLMAFVLTVGASLTSCGDIVSPDNPVEPTPTPTPTPTPAPETVVKATDLLRDAQKESATIAFWFYYEGNLYNVVFKKVGDDFVFQKGGNCSQASTRTDWILDDSNTIKGLGGTVEYNDLERLFFGVNISGTLVLAAQVASSTGDVFQRTFSANTYLAAMAVSNENTSMDKIMDMVKDLLLNKTSFNPDNKDLGQVMFVTVNDNTNQQQLQTIPEIMSKAGTQEITPKEAVGVAVENLKQNVKEGVENGSLKMPEFKFEKENPSVTWSPTASKNTYQQELQIEGVKGTVTYYTRNGEFNTCGAKIDAESGKVTFEKPGKVVVKAVLRETDGMYLASESYTLTVNKAEGSICYPKEPVKRTVGDPDFTITLEKVGNGEVTYSSDKETVATVDKNGLVKIVGIGEATITATIKEDTDYYHYETKTATCTVTVVEPEPDPSGIGDPDDYEKGGDPFNRDE